MTTYRMLAKALLAILSIFALSACGAVQQTVVDRNNALGAQPDKVNYLEAQQIAALEAWKDNPGKIINVYFINPVTGGLLIPAIQCMGVPTSSTESLEPNDGHPKSGTYTGWLVPIDGVDTITTEMAGRDGTYGDPVPYRQCLTIDNQYYDWTPYQNVLVTSASLAFAPATVQRDFAGEARLLAAEIILERGGCVNTETLVEIECRRPATPAQPPVAPTVAP